MDQRALRVLRPLSIAATSLLALAATARAQSAEAEQLFSDGDRLMKEGKLGEACDAFEASNKLEARAGTLIRLGECREQNHQLASAWSAYKDALTRVKDARKKEIATAKVAELEPRLSYLTVSVPDEARIDGLALARNGQTLDPVLWNRAVPVNGGKFVIAGRAPGHEEWQTTVNVPDEKGHVSVDVPKFKELGKLVPPPSQTKPVASAPGPADDEEEDRVATPSRWTGKRKAAVAVGGVAVAGIVAGTLLGRHANNKLNDAHAQCPAGPAAPCPGAMQANSDISEAQGFATFTNLTFGFAGAAAIAAGVLWFTGAPESSHRVAIVPGASSLAIVGRF
jgi:hypothetical protein